MFPVCVPDAVQFTVPSISEYESPSALHVGVLVFVTAAAGGAARGATSPAVAAMSAADTIRTEGRSRFVAVVLGKLDLPRVFEKTTPADFRPGRDLTDEWKRLLENLHGNARDFCVGWKDGRERDGDPARRREDAPAYRHLS